jgi:hypothetical protein
MHHEFLFQRFSLMPKAQCCSLADRSLERLWGTSRSFGKGNKRFRMDVFEGRFEGLGDGVLRVELRNVV